MIMRLMMIRFLTVFWDGRAVWLRRSRGKILALFLLALCCARPAAWGAQAEESAADNVLLLQSEISGDIGKLRAAIEAELSDMRLQSPDIALRLEELAALDRTASEDMASWDYTETQRERHSQVLSKLNVAYTAYSAIAQGQTSRPDAAASEDMAALGAATASPDINVSDALRQEINKVSKGLELQAFYLQTRLSKLRMDLAEAERLRKEMSEAQAGGQGLELPRTHVLELESARLAAVISWVRVRATRQDFDRNVALIQRLKRRLSDISERLTFPEEVLKSNLDGIQQRIDELEEEMEGARRALDASSAAVVRARAALGSADVTPLTPASSNFLARSARMSYWEYMTALIDDEISLMRESQQVWRDRYRLFHNQADSAEIWKHRDGVQARIQELQRQLEGIRTLESAVLRQIGTTQEQIEGTEGPVQQNMLQALDNQRRIIPDILNRYASLIPGAIFLQQRLYSEASDRVSALRIAAKVESVGRETVMGFLNTELWKGEDYSVTVGKLIIALLVFLSSFFLSSLGSHWIKRRMLKRFNASITAANATQRIVFYILWVAFALIALNIVKIPLTAFAFLGGAMAVGIGFGMQNIFNNLISGFIVIFSRPFKVNDIISVAGTEGTVQDIGSRSTTIKTWDSLDVILPNRYFLENSVTNWTGSDVKKRNILTVGVAYGADTRRVEELLLKAAKSHSKVLKDPQAFVLFKNFGESGLDFELYFWVDLKQASGPRVASDLRHHVLALFREEEIEIPYPQLDLHLIRPPRQTARED